MVVPGDIFCLKAGDRIPADGCVLGGDSLSCDESMLRRMNRIGLKNMRPQIPMRRRRLIVSYGWGYSDAAGAAVDAQPERVGRLKWAKLQICLAP